jgi:hypothetical protein
MCSWEFPQIFKSFQVLFDHYSFHDTSANDSFPNLTEIAMWKLFCASVSP